MYWAPVPSKSAQLDAAEFVLSGGSGAATATGLPMRLPSEVAMKSKAVAPPTSSSHQLATGMVDAWNIAAVINADNDRIARTPEIFLIAPPPVLSARPPMESEAGAQDFAKMKTE